MRFGPGSYGFVIVAADSPILVMVVSDLRPVYFVNSTNLPPFPGSQLTESLPQCKAANSTSSDDALLLLSGSSPFCFHHYSQSRKKRTKSRYF